LVANGDGVMQSYLLHGARQMYVSTWRPGITILLVDGMLW